ncbi:hypothetical protein GII63_18615, partial [Escherichia coli]|nr:hypothetical protein [Escherichia coli]
LSFSKSVELHDTLIGHYLFINN